ncbi:MAG: DUF393 domain-containing protein, partial [Candidatus Omnitrophica bacterium]|nr:DUF393 domain-containing protein [Candidatus Omnitrophota bacterium]
MGKITRPTLLYDGNCRFCAANAQRLKTLDLFDRLALVNYHTVENLSALDPRLTRKLCHSQIHLLEKNGTLNGGFLAFRRISVLLPLLWPVAPLLHLPGTKKPGQALY